MESRIAALEQQVAALITKFLPPVSQHLHSLDARISILEQARQDSPAPMVSPQTMGAGDGKRTRKPMTYEVYIQVKGLAAEGMSEKDISIKLDIPYTTVRKYLEWTEEEVIRRKQKMVAEQKQQPKSVPNAEVEDAVYTELPKKDPGIAHDGWYVWSDTHRLQASQSKDEDTGYPTNAPCSEESIVVVQYKTGGYSQPTYSKFIEWGSFQDTNAVVKWRYAMQEEIAQYS